MTELQIPTRAELKRRKQERRRLAMRVEVASLHRAIVLAQQRGAVRVDHPVGMKLYVSFALAKRRHDYCKNKVGCKECEPPGPQPTNPNESTPSVRAAEVTNRERDAKDAEIERLRVALQRIANTAPPRNMTAANVRTTLSGVQSIARVALESEVG